MTLKLQYEPPAMEELELHDFVLAAKKKNDKSVIRKEDLDDTEEEDEI